MAAGVLGARLGLTPFGRLRERLMAVRRGEYRRVEGVYPNEVQPLIDDLNALLEDREKAVKRALATAGDLAHGLKTPLALLGARGRSRQRRGKPRMGSHDFSTSGAHVPPCGL